MYLEELINLGVALEHGALTEHFHKDHAARPHVHGRGVRLGAQQNLGGAIPQRHHLVRQGPNRRDEGTGQAEISNFQPPFFGDQQILWLKVSVHNSPGMAKGEAVENLEEEGLDDTAGELPRLGLHVFFQVSVDELEDEV